jgi:HD-GYP domain-containing protein (c-di-GMP phosphodiesterase class II)
MKDLAFALQTYDLGLSGVPDEILYKTPPLEPEEWQIIHQHVEVGLELMKGLDVPQHVLSVIKHHHEHYDGTGYPDKLVGEDIPLESRLLGLADALTSMLQGRPYRRAQSLADALSDMESKSGRQFCPRSLAMFLEEAKKYTEVVREIQDSRFLAMPDESNKESKDLVSSPI